MADHLDKLYPIEDVLALVSRKHYTLAHEFVGAKAVINDLREIADDLDSEQSGEA